MPDFRFRFACKVSDFGVNWHFVRTLNLSTRVLICQSTRHNLGRTVRDVIGGPSASMRTASSISSGLAETRKRQSGGVPCWKAPGVDRRNDTLLATSIFICHGSPTDDNLLELYAQKPFDKVFVAIEKLGELLAPLFASVPDPFPADQKKHNPGLSPATIAKIRRRRQAGFKYRQICDETGLFRAISSPMRG